MEPEVADDDGVDNPLLSRREILANAAARRRLLDLEGRSTEEAFHVGRRMDRLPRVFMLLLVAAGIAFYFDVVLTKMFDFSGSVVIPITIWVSVSAFVGAIWEFYFRSSD